jgi:Protein of unknown function (DUF3558)
MSKNIFISLLCFVLLALVGCQKHVTTQPSSDAQAAASPAKQQSGPAKFDACGLIKKEEVEAIQGSPITGTQSSGQSGKGFIVSECYYVAKDSSRSVSLTVTQGDPSSPARGNPKDFWNKTFGRYSGEEKEQERDKEKTERERNREEREKSVPPKKINGIGDDGYWSVNRFGDALYVLKKDSFIRISVGGSDNEEAKLNKSKALAREALQRL